MPAESFGAALNYFTGSKDHNVVIRKRANELGLTLNEYGLFKIKKGSTKKARSRRARAWQAARRKKSIKR